MTEKKKILYKSLVRKVATTLLERKFLFEELVKRDFKQKYKRTVLGMAWSILSPLLTLLVMRLVFTQFFGRNTSYYTTYLFAGNLMFSYFRESTNGGMNALMSNARIITKINVPKYLFLFSKNVSAVINFGLTLVVFFVFVAIDGVPFHFSMFGIIYPIITLTMFNIGVGMILSAMFVFFRDTAYLVFAERIIPLLKIPINTGKTLNYKCISGKIDAGFYAFRHQISCI